MYAARLEKHYMSGTWYGQSATGTVYLLATVLERTDNDLLWCVLLDTAFAHPYRLNFYLG